MQKGRMRRRRRCRRTTRRKRTEEVDDKETGEEEGEDDDFQCHLASYLHVACLHNCINLLLLNVWKPF